MSGKRLLDAIQLLNATTSIASKHLALRQRQLDVFTRTSSLTKGIQSQTEGLIMTARAAAALARRFDEPDTSDHAPKPQHPSPAPTAAPPHAASLSPDEAKQSQRRAEAQIPASVTEHSGGGDGKVGVSPQQDVFYQPSAESSTHLSGLPRVKVPKSASDVQVSAKDGINADVFHTSASSTDPSAERTPSPEEQGEIPDEVMSQVFHSPRVARVLSQKGATDGFNPYRLAAQKNPPSRVGRETEKVDSVAADQPASPILTVCTTGAAQPKGTKH